MQDEPVPDRVFEDPTVQSNIAGALAKVSEGRAKPGKTARELWPGSLREVDIGRVPSGLKEECSCCDGTGIHQPECHPGGGVSCADCDGAGARLTKQAHDIVRLYKELARGSS